MSFKNPDKLKKKKAPYKKFNQRPEIDAKKKPVNKPVKKPDQ